MASLRDVLPAPRNAAAPTASAPPESAAAPPPTVRVVGAAAPAAAGVTSVLALGGGGGGAAAGADELDFAGAIARAGEGGARVVHVAREAVVERGRDARLRAALVRPGREAEAAAAARTRAALDPIVRGKETAARVGEFRGREAGARRAAPEFVRYTPAGGAGEQRIIKMVQAPVDPMEPPRFSQKKTPVAPPSPPVPVLHSPARPLSKEEQADWIVPPAISNWKNNRGYTVPLDKRLASGAAALRDNSINDKFAALAETLYSAEREARQQVEARARIQRNVSLRAKEAKEKQLRDLAARAREERAGFAPPGAATQPPPEVSEARVADRGLSRLRDAPPPDLAAAAAAAPRPEEAAQSPARRPRSSRFGDRRGGDGGEGGAGADEADVRRRDAIREEARRKREREMRGREQHDGDGDAARPTLKRSKLARDRDRDLAERVALGQRGGAGGGGSSEVAYDQRLFNQGGSARGMAAGFGGEDADALYDAPLFDGGKGSKFQYHPKGGGDGGGGDEDGGGRGMARFRPNRALGGGQPAAAGGGGLDDGPRTRPVEFERDEGRAETAAADPFGLDAMLGKM